MRPLKPLLALPVLALALFAQTDRGTITGTVTDPAGAVVPNAVVQARNVATGVIYPAATSNTGNYTLPQLPAGTYDLTVTAPGFKGYTRTGIVVEVAATERVDAAVEVGAPNESVTITAEAPLLQTEGGEQSYNENIERLDLLPIFTLGGVSASGAMGNVRNPLQEVQLLPGSQFTNDNTLRINGMPSSSQSIAVEGQDATNGIWREQNQINQVSTDAIQEVAIQTSSFAPEYGQAGGGYFNYTMKSGTNQLHGSGYDYFVNEFLNAGLPFTDAGTLNPNKEGQHIRNAIRQNDFGFTLGGPIWIPKIYSGKNHTFFFFNFEQFRQSRTITNGVFTVPTALYRQGNFSQALGVADPPDPLGRPEQQNEIYDPNTTRNVTVNGQNYQVRDPFPNNTIPLTRMDPAALKVQAMIPLPLGSLASQLINNYQVPAYNNYLHTTIPSLKIDQNVGDKIKLSGFLSGNRQWSPGNNGFTQPFTSAEPTDQTSWTARLNYDETITPTMLLHLGVGYLQTSLSPVAQTYDQSQLFGSQTFYANQFPYLSGLSTTAQGGDTVALGTSFSAPLVKELKPTSNASFTWVRGNHTIKIGMSLVFDGTVTFNTTRANGQFAFAAAETSNPWQNGQPFTNFAPTGFPYASFLMGLSDSLTLSQVTDSRLGNHSIGLYIQDNWKVTRKLTLVYGLRWDYANLLQEEHGRMQDAAFNLPNPAIGGRDGTVIYGATCNCSFNKNYPYAIGPRLGIAYQITSKTVFRGGAGVVYSTSPNNAFLSYSVPNFYTVGAPGYGIPAAILSQGNPFAPGNPFGNPPIVWPDFTTPYPLQVAPGIRPPLSPFVSIDPNAGRLPRIAEWSVGFQHELRPNLLLDISYVGNRGVWWTAPLLATINYNALTPQGLLSQYGLNVQNAADLALLNDPINNPAVIARFPWLANPNNVYPGFPAGQTLRQALRPYPQWSGVPPFLGPPLGDTWYDSLQVRLTKRLSHGLDLQAAFTWEKDLTNGANSDTSYLTPNPPLINDVYNYGLDKQLAGAFDRPLMLIVSANYTTPRLPGDSFKAASWLVRDWTIGAVLRYQSGALIRVPPSNNNLLLDLDRGVDNNPALWGGGTTFWNFVPGQPYLLKNPNCGCFDPTTTSILNPGAWTDAPTGTFGYSAPYYNNYRWQRQPAESASIGRVFRVRERASLQIRAEFQNIFNRLFLAAPSVGAGVSPASPTTRNSLGQLTGGYGYINTVNGNGDTPRSGQLVARFTF